MQMTKMNYRRKQAKIIKQYFEKDFFKIIL